jgi:hypothetical protein
MFSFSLLLLVRTLALALLRVDHLFQRIEIAILGNRCRGNVELLREPIELLRLETGLTQVAVYLSSRFSFW